MVVVAEEVAAEVPVRPCLGRHQRLVPAKPSGNASRLVSTLVVQSCSNQQISKQNCLQIYRTTLAGENIDINVT